MIRPSPFLIKKEKWLESSDHCFIFENEFPVIKGHVLIVPKREIENYFELTAEEWTDIKKLVENYISRTGAIGFNLGFNSGEIAGQSVAHIHFHIFPHYTDSPGMPKGGYCNAFGALPDYYNR